jgi:DNA-directed RNA polymerase subunit K/omega
VSGAALPLPESESQPFVAASGSKFLLVTVAFRRVVQIRAGARPRVHVESRQPTVLAVAEVLAGCVPYGVADGPEPEDDSRP